jgi:outer membrane receptor protein involved in Fe transport
MSTQQTLRAFGLGLYRTLCRGLVAVPVTAALFGQPAAAQEPTGRIEGTVTAGGTGTDGVAVLVEGTNRSAVTDSRGVYRIADVAPGAYTLVTRRIGYHPARAAVVVTAGQVVRADIVIAQAPLVLGDVVISATREAERRVEVPITIGVIDSALLRSVHPAHPSEIMNRVAGVWVNVTGGEGHMTAIRQPLGTDPVYLFLEDGVPSRSTGFFNHNALYEINIPQADRIEVTKGPANALYGSDAIGGVVNVSTRAPSRTPELTFSAEGGENAWGRGLITASNTWGASGVRADVNYTRTDGWRRATDYDRQSATVRWDQDLGGGAGLKTLATVSLIDQRTAGTSLVSRDDYLNNPTVNYTPISLREVKAYRASTAYSRETGRSLLSLTPYARYDWMRLLPNWSLTYDPQDYTTDNYSAGVLAKYRRDFAPLRTRLIVGLDADYSPGGQVEYALTATRDANRIFTSYRRDSLIYDYDVAYRGVSPYVQLEASPAARLRVTGGLRYDYSGYAYDTHLAPLAGGRWRRPADTTVSYTHLSPKVGATYELDPAVNLFVSYRHGFRAPSQGQLFRQGSAANTVGLEPVKADNYEAGLRGRVGARVDYDLALYSLVKRDDILSYTRLDGSTEVQNAGRTSHRGVEATLGVQATAALRLDVAYSYARHEYESWSPRAGVTLSGNEMANAPRHLGSATLTVAPARLAGAQASLEWTRVGGYWQDAENTHWYAGHQLLHARATYPLGPHFTLSARVMNLTNRRYAETSAYTAARGEEYAPGMPRTVYVTGQYAWR